LAKGLEEKYADAISKLEKDFYKSVQRYSGKTFYRKQLAKNLKIGEWDSSKLFDEFDVDKNGVISMEELRHGMKHIFHIHLTPSQLKEFQAKNGLLDRQTFASAFEGLFHQ
jgi:EF hand